MSVPTSALVQPTAALLPPAWAAEPGGERVRIYNPSLTRDRGRLLLAYRLDAPWPTQPRRIAICQLHADLTVIPGSVVPFSASLPADGTRPYDPRWLVVGDRLWLHFNNNYQTQPNRLFLVEVDPHTLTAAAPPRLVELSGPRQVIEKNWMFFDHDGNVYAVYRIAPHTILRVDLTGDAAVRCTPLPAQPWTGRAAYDLAAYTARYGDPCGGAPPVRQGSSYVSFFHSRSQAAALRSLRRFFPHDLMRLPRGVRGLVRRLHRWVAQRRYYGGVYAFAAAPPFTPLWIKPTPVLDPAWEGPRTVMPPANPLATSVAYPCGAVDGGEGKWLVSYGVHDERCCLRRVVVEKPPPGYG